LFFELKSLFFFFSLFFFTPQPPPQCLPVSAASPTVRISPLRRAVVLTLAATRAGYSYTGASEHQFCDIDIDNGFQFSKPLATPCIFLQNYPLTLISKTTTTTQQQQQQQQ
jgi:hypothetical protein